MRAILRSGIWLSEPAGVRSCLLFQGTHSNSDFSLYRDNYLYELERWFSEGGVVKTSGTAWIKIFFLLHFSRSLGIICSLTCCSFSEGVLSWAITLFSAPTASPGCEFLQFPKCPHAKTSLNSLFLIKTLVKQFTNTGVCLIELFPLNMCRGCIAFWSIYVIKWDISVVCLVSLAALQ